MKSVKLATVLTIILTLFCSFSAYAEEEIPSASADVSVFSKYVWRGYELSDDSLVIQPSATVSYKGFSMNLWGNLDTAVDDGNPLTDDDSDLNETDWTLSYDTSFGPVSLGAGFIYYALNGTDTEEIYVSVGLDVFLAPSLTIYKDIAEFNGWYANLGISHSFALPKEISLDLSAGVGYYYSEDDTFTEFDDVGGVLVGTTNRYKNIHDGVLSAALTIPVNKYISISPSITYSFPLSDEADDLLTATSFSNDSDHLYGGITCSLSF